jgi:hypothetical protein
MNLEPTPDLDLEKWEKASLAAEDAFGTFKLHNAIQKARKENLITEAEEAILLDIKEFIRNAFIHSDKSKIFDSDSKTQVDAVKVEDGQFKHTGSRDISMLGLNIAQGIAEKELANRECGKIVQQIDTIIVEICDRFWKTHSRSQAQG